MKALIAVMFLAFVLFASSTLVVPSAGLTPDGTQCPQEIEPTAMLTSTDPVEPLSPCPDLDLWIRQFGSSMEDFMLDTALDASGILIVGGTFGSLAGKANAGSADAMIRRYAADGTATWTRQFGTSSFDQLSGVAADATGVYVTGTTFYADGARSFLQKYDYAGNEVWTLPFGEVGTVVGKFALRGTYLYLAGHDLSPGGHDAFVRKFDVAGTELWFRQFGSPGEDRAVGVGVDLSGVYVAGTTSGALPGQSNNGLSDIFVRKYDFDGKELWTQQFGSGGEDVAWDVQWGGAGLYLAGTTNGALGGAYGGLDAFIARLDPYGNRLWIRQVGTKSDEPSAGVAIDGTGAYVVGATGGALPGQQSAGALDAYMRKYDFDGREVWTRQFGTPSDELGLGVDVDPTGIYAIGNTFGAFADQSNSGEQDVFVIKLLRDFPNELPVLGAIDAAPNPAFANDAVSLSALASDKDGDVLTYTWTFGDGTSTKGGVGPGGGTIRASHVYESIGVHEITLVVADGKGGKATWSTRLSVESAPSYPAEPPRIPTELSGGNEWTTSYRVPSGGPGMAYDSQSDRVILLGDGNDEYTWAFDFQAKAWLSTNLAEGPPRDQRWSYLAYDSQSDVVVLFAWGATWAYDFESSAWTKLNSPSHPSDRLEHAMAYDAQSDRIILFGGAGPPFPTWLGDTWSFDFETNTWTQMFPAVRPPPLRGHAMTYDAQSNRVILFGGSTDWGMFSSETWSYDFETNRWENLGPPIAPSGINFKPSMAYDAQSDRVVLVGRHLQPAETWTYSLESNTWTNMNPAMGTPDAFENPMTYDSRSDRILLFNGRMWAYHLESNAWTDLTPARPRPVTDRNAMAYDTQSDRIIQFGGARSFGPYILGDDTLAYNFETDSWTNMSPQGGPLPRVWHAMAYDSQSDRVILFGGEIGSGISDETWAYDFETNAWQDMHPGRKPPARWGHAMTYDTQSDRIILFGGSDVFSSLDHEVGDTWSYDFEMNKWIEMTPAKSPSPRVQHAMAYDAGSDRAILFGGRTCCFADDETWAYDFDTNTWVAMSPAIKPIRQWLHMMAYNERADRVILFGSGPLRGGTWAYDYDANTWTDLRPLTSPLGNCCGYRSMAYDSQSDVMVLDGGITDQGFTWWYFYDPPAKPALLRVTTYPAVPGKIFVDGVPRDEWGLSWVKLTPGSHTTSFGDVYGFGRPGPRLANLVPGEITEVVGTYETWGTLRVTTDPPVPATIYVNGAPSNDWGMWRAVEPGTYVVSFGLVAGYDPPAPQTVTVGPGQHVHVAGAFTPNPAAPGPSGFGLLRVTTNPPTPATILVNGIPRDEWGLNWVKVPQGTYTVSSRGGYGATAPLPVVVSVIEGGITEYQANFLPHGGLRVVTDPPMPATIYVNGYARNDWGMWQSMLPGTYEVSFGQVNGFATPPPQMVTVTAGELATVIGVYSQASSAGSTIGAESAEPGRPLPDDIMAAPLARTINPKRTFID